MSKNYIERYWRDAKPEDAIKEPPMMARFRDSLDCNSAISIWSDPMHLVGWDRTDSMNWCNGQCWWKFCQVYDAPDPGEGYELIDICKTQKQEGDEYLHSSGAWKKADQAPFCPRDTYRRRITPAITYVPFTWEDREQLRGRWIERDLIELQITDFRYENGLYVNRIDTDSLCKYWKFIDTGKPVGKEIVNAS